MKKTIVALGVLAGLAFMALPSGCYWDNEEDLYGPDPTVNCDTTNIRFSVEIKQIMADHCNTCHLSTGPTYSSIPYETYDQFKAVALNGKLVHRINDVGSPMPETGLMSLCNRLKIEAWVKAGALDN